MKKCKYFKVTVVDEEIKLERLADDYNPIKPSPFDLKLTKTGVISVSSRFGQNYVSGYWPYSSGYCLDWPGKVLLKLDELVKKL